VFSRTPGRGARSSLGGMDAPHLHLAPTPANPDARRSSGKGPIGVILAEDHEQMRRSLRMLLDVEEGLEVIAEVDDLASVVQHLRRQRPPVVVLGLGMPDKSVGEVIGTLRAAAPWTQIVVLTMNEDPVLAQRALAAGALGFVAKDLADVELAEAIRKAAQGKQYVSPRVASRLGALDRALVEDKLSAREVEVLRLIALGHTNVEIAHQLHLSPRTVETHRARIHRKLGLTTRAELVRYALGRGLLRI
jgi:two-component system response regulator NreC